MIIWRGWGLLVIVCGLVGVGVVLPIGMWFAAQAYPNHPYAFDMLKALQPLVYGAVMLGIGVVAGVLSWFVGRWFNRESNHSSLFFIPFQWWGVVFPVLGLGLLATTMTSGGGLKGAHSEFVAQCAKHERGGNTERCDCMASAIEAGSEPTVYIPFYAELNKAWRGRDSDENVVPHFLESYVVTLPQAQGEAFAQALDKSLACFPGDNGAPPTEPEKPAPAESAPTESAPT